MGLGPSYPDVHHRWTGHEFCTISQQLKKGHAMGKQHLQNRVDPMGGFHSDSSKAALLMGNRGILHDGEKNIVRKWAGKSWVACDPHFKSIDRRPLFQPNRYSELFFLDEATAYSAGHRPCWYCQRERYLDFKNTWEKCFASGSAPLHVKQIDDQLHRDRAMRGGDKATYGALLGELPDGTFVEIDGKAFLVRGERLLEWSLNGYVTAIARDSGLTVKVLTPKSIVQLYSYGLQASVHPSAGSC